MFSACMGYCCVIEESSAYFEQADVYKNSELFQLGRSDDENSDEESCLASFDKLKKRMTNVTPDGGALILIHT